MNEKKFNDDYDVLVLKILKDLGDIKSLPMVVKRDILRGILREIEQSIAFTNSQPDKGGVTNGNTE